MARQTESRWRLHSREVIRQVLASLPKDATDKEKRKAVREAYPFGVRRNHPYKAWLKEVALALGTTRRPKELLVGIVSSGHGSLPLVVRCDYCHNSACLMCRQLRRRRAEQDATTDWQGWLRWMDRLNESPKDQLTYSAFADWLVDQDWPEEAARIRALGCKEVPNG